MRSERGYILATSLLLLAVLSVLGAVGAYKAMLGTRIAKVKGDYARAKQAAESGLAQLFWYWTQAQDNTPGCTHYSPPDPGCVEREAVIAHVLQGSALPADAPFVADLYGESLADLDRNAGGIDARIQRDPHVRVYAFVLDANGNPVGMQPVPNANWGQGQDVQVAVWTTSYKKPQPGQYPYGDANAGCTGSGCMLVTYALGRDGEVRALVREAQGFFTHRLTGVTAITNAPPYATWTDLCNLTNGNATGANLSWSSNRDGRMLVEATQAPYVLSPFPNGIANPAPGQKNDAIPSGTALSSNTNMGLGGKKFRKKTSSTSELTSTSTPLLVYSTHRSTQGVRAQWADWNGSAMDPAGADDPYPILPKDILRPGLAATPDKIRYFDVAGDGQLFALNVYRWLAEQFTCQHVLPDPANPAGAIDPSTGTSTDPYANGAFCKKAVELQRRIMALYPLPAAEQPPAGATLADKVNRYWPKITGRLTVEDFWRNVRDGRPMFGVVRVMYPAKPFFNTGQACKSAGGRIVTLYDVLKTPKLDNITLGASVSFPSGRTVTIGVGARVVIYGMFLLDYFTDNNTNLVFDAASGERLLLPIESTDAYLKLEVPLLVNPALPAGAAGAQLTPFPTIASTGRIVGGVERVVNNGGGMLCRRIARRNVCRDNTTLASPFDGWFPDSEGMIAPPASAPAPTDGMMALMDPTGGTNGIIGHIMAELMGAPVRLSPGATPSLNADFTGASLRLYYYYKLMYQTTDRGRPQYWPISSTFPTDLGGAFCIGALDCASGNHDGDKLHLLFPSGYAHAWKAVLAAFDMRAEEWNGALRGVVCAGGACGPQRSIVDLARMHRPLADYGDPTHPLGSPFGPEIKLVKDATGNVRQVPFDIVADAQEYLSKESDYFYVTPDPLYYPGQPDRAYGVIDSAFRDLPALTYSGGILDTHTHNNVSGIVYTPSALEWETANVGGIGYITGAVITGLGMYNKTAKSNTRQIYVFDPQAVDNINTQNSLTIMLRFAHQALR